MLSCFMASPDCAKAVSDAARKHMAIKLRIIFFMNSPCVIAEFAPAHPSRTNEMRRRQQGYKLYR
jgi:hypothetical protein